MGDSHPSARLRIGIAGYTGAGKSTAARFFAEFGAHVVNADAVAKSLIRDDERIGDNLRAAFGDGIFDTDRCISFPCLRQRVLQSREMLQTLNSIVHPPLVQRLRTLLDQACARVTVLDAALIPLWDIEDWFDLRLWVSAGRELRRTRLIARAGLDDSEAERFVTVQEQILAKPDEAAWMIIENDSGEEALRRKLETIAKEQLHLEAYGR
jgi:dephospho-CoA kinase